MGGAKRVRTPLLAAALALAAAGCATPVGVERVPSRAVYLTLTANVLTRGEPSFHSTQLLNLLDLAGAYQRDPKPVLAEVRERYLSSGFDTLLFNLAELSFDTAERTGDRSYYRAAALYAYAYLFPEDPQRAPDPYDPRLRLAMDLYNLGLTEGLSSSDGEVVEVQGGAYALPFGALVIEPDPSGLEWGGYRLEHFVPAAKLEVRGLRNRHRQRGIGAPLAATTVPDGAGARGRARSRFVPQGTRAAVTAFLRLERPRAAIASRRVPGRLELIPFDEAAGVEVGGRRVPLEAEVSSTFAYNLEAADVWRFSLKGFRSGDFRVYDEGLVMLHPYRRGRIPVVLVHGTASSPATWAQTVNELLIATPLKRAYQYWLFIYNTGNPILYSAAQLRSALIDAVATLDPEGSDPALRQMVVVGHSQGGLLTKLIAVDSGDVIWNSLSDVPFDQLDLDEEDRAVLRDWIFFQPLPFVRRVVFMATPHHGSFLAEGRLGRFAASLVQLPGDLLDRTADLIERNPTVLRRAGRTSTSIDDMRPGAPFLEVLASMPIAEGIDAHSIIAVQTPGPVEDGNDGVVAYRSAHLEGVVSEKVVESGHSVQNDPIAILELGRILIEHRRAVLGVDADAAPADPG